MPIVLGQQREGAVGSWPGVRGQSGAGLARGGGLIGSQIRLVGCYSEHHNHWSFWLLGVYIERLSSEAVICFFVFRALILFSANNWFLNKNQWNGGNKTESQGTIYLYLLKNRLRYY